MCNEFCSLNRREYARGYMCIKNSRAYVHAVLAKYVLYLAPAAGSVFAKVIVIAVAGTGRRILLYVKKTHSVLIEIAYTCNNFCLRGGNVSYNTFAHITHTHATSTIKTKRH